MIKKLFIQARTKSGFQQKLSEGEIQQTSIAFIEDTKEIWTHGIYYPCPYTKDQIDQLFSDIQNASEEQINQIKQTIDNYTINGYKISTNPSLNKSDLQLGKVDNTSDLNKPISTATQAALNQKVNNSITVNGHSLTNNVTVTKADVGLGNVTNESKATMFTSPAFTGTPTAPTASSSTNNTQIATTAFVQTLVNNKIAASDAMIYKGTIGSTGATITALPTTHSTGWTYKVITAGTYAGQQCEVGDMIVCITDGTSSNNSHWSVIQTNVDGVVTGPASSVDGHVAVFNGSTGKIIKDSGFTIGKSVPADAKFTDTTYTLSSFGITATAQELNYTDGVTSNIQTQLNNKAASTHTHNYAGSSSAGGAANTALALTTSAGTATQPVYFSSGKPVACTYTLGASVPSGAIFTDTKNTAGSTNTTSKIFLIGATAQASSATTYSQDTAYVGTDGCLYSNSTKVSVEGHTHDKISVKDNRDVEMLPNNMGDRTLTTFFNMKESMPSASWWSGIHICGWTSSNYAAWQLAGPSNQDAADAKALYFRSGHGSTWNNWQKVAFTSDLTWSSISGKPSSFTPSSHTHTIAQISDLNSSWDSLLKVAPTTYVTRWPTISEVTGKQNLVIKLNSGTTEGTNLFTYAGTAAKTVNITPSSIGAAASSHTHTGANITGLTASMALASDANGHVTASAVTATELGYLDGVTSNIQTQLNNKVGKSTSLSGYGITDGVNAVSVTGSGNAVTTASVSGHTLTLNKGTSFAASSHTHTGSDIKGLTGLRALVTDTSGNITSSAVTSTELGYLDGVTSNIQTQLSGKAASSHTHTISQISDLQSSWDALLKAAPSSYVTRWPAFSEVTSRPTTLSGYGITDGATKKEVQGAIDMADRVPHGIIGNISSINLSIYKQRFYLISISSSTSFGVRGSLSDGLDILYIIKNAGSAQITITIPNSGTYINCSNVDSITIEPGKYGEIHIISDGDHLYIRAV